MEIEFKKKTEIPEDVQFSPARMAERKEKRMRRYQEWAQNPIKNAQILEAAKDITKRLAAPVPRLNKERWDEHADRKALFTRTSSSFLDFCLTNLSTANAKSKT